MCAIYLSRSSHPRLIEETPKKPIAVRGAFDFKLADMAMALNRAGATNLNLGDLPALPSRALSAMAGAWSAAAEATQRGH